jgi:hypothetical protein
MISTDASNPKALRGTVTRRGAGVGSALCGPYILVMPSGKGLPYPPQNIPLCEVDLGGYFC